MIIVTFLILSTSIVVYLQSNLKDQEKNQRKALQIAEYGLQEALEQVNESPSWRTGFSKTSCDDGWYAVICRQRHTSDSLYVILESEGHFGSIARKKTCLLGHALSGTDSLWVKISLY
jgi:Tfp pilus assembly protein PilX